MSVMGNSVLGQQLERGGAKTKAAAFGRPVSAGKNAE
jgi:hypothetical protein